MSPTAMTNGSGMIRRSPWANVANDMMPPACRSLVAQNLNFFFKRSPCRPMSWHRSRFAPRVDLVGSVATATNVVF